MSGTDENDIVKSSDSTTSVNGSIELSSTTATATPTRAKRSHENTATSATTTDGGDERLSAELNKSNWVQFDGDEVGKGELKQVKLYCNSFERVPGEILANQAFAHNEKKDYKQNLLDYSISEMEK